MYTLIGRLHKNSPLVQKQYPLKLEPICCIISAPCNMSPATGQGLRPASCPRQLGEDLGPGEVSPPSRFAPDEPRALDNLVKT